MGLYLINADRLGITLFVIPRRSFMCLIFQLIFIIKKELLTLSYNKPRIKIRIEY